MHTVTIGTFDFRQRIDCFLMGFVLVKKRWIVERTLGWWRWSRRWVQDTDGALTVQGGKESPRAWVE